MEPVDPNQLITLRGYTFNQMDPNTFVTLRGYKKNQMYPNPVVLKLFHVKDPQIDTYYPAGPP